MDPWNLLDIYFRDHVYPFTQHHIDSYREFIRTHLPNTIRTYNPVTMIKVNAAEEEILRVEVFVGGRDAKQIYFERPVTVDNDGEEMILTPQEARLRNLTYAGHLYADVIVDYTHEGVKKTVTFPMTFLGSLPIMLHSDACILHQNGSKILQSFGECPMDPGGYFIVDGKEKVIISQERDTTNRLMVEKVRSNPNFSYRGTIHCTAESGEYALIPRTVKLFMIARPDNTYEPSIKQEFQGNEGAILVSLPSIQGYIPLMVLFRALGMETDRIVADAICGKEEPAIREKMLDLLRPSFAYSTKDIIERPVRTMNDALEYMKDRVFYQSVRHVKTLLVSDIFPNVQGTLFDKAMYLCTLVQQLLKTSLGMYPVSDRDGYVYKRINISGFLLAGLFQETYNTLRKHIREEMDRQYNYGPWKNMGAGEIQNLIRVENLSNFFPPALLTDTFHRSLKGNWGPLRADPEQGLVQDLSRGSYIGFMSHLRRVNNPLDPSIKIRSPHQLHPQQWGVMCPFESPDGAAIGYLKNFAILTQITFGTHTNTIIQCFQELDLKGLTILPLSKIAPHFLSNVDYVRIHLNGTIYGITNDPLRFVRAMRLLRRNGLINPFVSISWNIKERDIRIQTESGRPCRPLFIVEHGTMIANNHKFSKEVTWYDLLLGSLLSKEERTSSAYYRDQYESPFTMSAFQGKSLDEILKELEKTQGVIEYLDIEEANTCLIAMDESKLGTLHTHAEIHATTLFSVVTQIVPFANHNQAPRVIFHGAQSKQAVGVYATNFQKRFDTMAYIQHYPQKRIVTTRGAHYNGSAKMPNGCNVIVAVMSHTGYNQEDSIILNRSSVDRGLFHITAYKTMTAIEKTINPRERLMFANPAVWREDGREIQGRKHANYQLLDKDGFVREESYIPRGQKAVVLGMVHVTQDAKEVRRGVFTETVVEEVYKDVSISTDVHHYGKVDKVYVATQNYGAASRIAKVRFRKVRRPELGDKACLTPDHEVLTIQGWKPIAEIKKEDMIYVLKSDGTFGYENPIDFTVKDCKNEDIYHINGSHIDLCVTQDHSMWIRKDNKRDYERIMAKDIIGQSVYYSKSAMNQDNVEMQHLQRWFEENVPICVATLNEANEIQRLALHAGWSADIEYHDDKYNISILKEKETNQIDKQELIPYTGKVYCFEVPSHVFYVRRNGKPVWIGNCSSHGQKGVFGMILPQEDMPISKDGMVPDIIINPHAFPSRMTIGHLVETVMAKVCCLEGTYGDGTVFMPLDTEQVYDELEKREYERHGNEILYNGKTGQMIETEVFFGPIYYYRLKHMVTDKVHARGQGPRVLLTHQPAAGRSKEGGLRIGEMEKDALLSYGLAQFVKETMMEKSDKYKWGVCRHCGTLVPRATVDSICSGCHHQDIMIIETPYAFKLLTQELEAMGLQMRLSGVENDRIDSSSDDESSSDEEEIIEVKHDSSETSDSSEMNGGTIEIPTDVVSEKEEVELIDDDIGDDEDGEDLDLGGDPTGYKTPEWSSDEDDQEGWVEEDVDDDLEADDVEADDVEADDVEADVGENFVIDAADSVEVPVPTTKPTIELREPAEPENIMTNPAMNDTIMNDIEDDGEDNDIKVSASEGGGASERSGSEEVRIVHINGNF